MHLPLQLHLPLYRAISWSQCHITTLASCAQAVTLEHVPRAIAFDTSSAPRQVAVLGFRGQPGARAGNSTTLLTLAYDLAKGDLARSLTFCPTLHCTGEQADVCATNACRSCADIPSEGLGCRRF